jgi:hypothetical protein
VDVRPNRAFEIGIAKKAARRSTLALGAIEMTASIAEGEWLASLETDDKVAFLVKLSHEITIAARFTYTPQTDGLDKPALLRVVNDIQHRVLACVDQLLNKRCNDEFLRSISNWVLAQTNL